MSNINLSGIGMTSQRTRSRLVQRLMLEGIRDQDVLNLIENTPRHLFVDEALSHRAYEDTALPIGMGQTISQPYIVARMTEALIAAGRPRKVLEIGTGCGYQAAILAQLCDQVYTLERIGSLQAQAKSRLARLGLRNVQYRHGDGLKGWESAAPFDGIIVTAAPAQVPNALLNQLAEGGRMIIPVGHSGGAQDLLLIERQNGEFTSTELCKVRFVPLLGGTLA